MEGSLVFATIVLVWKFLHTEDLLQISVRNSLYHIPIAYHGLGLGLTFCYIMFIVLNMHMYIYNETVWSYQNKQYYFG